MKSHVRTPIDAKRLADFLAKIEAYEVVLLQRQRDIENQVVLYHIKHTREQAAEVPRPASLSTLRQNKAADELSSRFAPVDLTTLQVYEEYR